MALTISPTALTPSLTSLEGIQPRVGGAAVKPFQLPDAPAFQPSTTGSPTVSGVASGEPTTYGHLVQQMIRDVNDVQQTAGAKVRDVLQGGKTSVHEAMISVEEASVSFTMLSEMRNKLVESYQEVMRMQV